MYVIIAIIAAGFALFYCSYQIRLGAYVMAWTVPFNALFMPVEVFAGAMRGTGCSVLPTVITCVCVCVFRVVWVYTIFAHFQTITSLYLLYIFSWVITGIAEYLYFRASYKKSIVAAQMW